MVGRNTQGVRLIRTADNEHVVGLQRIEEVESDNSEYIEEDGQEPALQAGDDADSGAETTEE